MKKFGRATILDVLDHAKKEFLDSDSPAFVRFDYRGHLVLASFDSFPNNLGFYVDNFKVVYSRCVMNYSVDSDYDFVDAYFLVDHFFVSAPSFNSVAGSRRL